MATTTRQHTAETWSVQETETAQPEVGDQLMEEEGEEAAVQTVKLEVPSDLPPGEQSDWSSKCLK